MVSAFDLVDATGFGTHLVEIADRYAGVALTLGTEADPLLNGRGTYTHPVKEECRPLRDLGIISCSKMA